MFYDQRLSAPGSPEELRTEYEADLAAVVDEHGLETVAAETDVDRDALETIGDGATLELDLEEAAQIQALAADTPDAETIVTMACDHLLLGMSSAVLDVEALESELEIDLEAKEIQQKIERRAPMTFEEFVYLQHAIADGMP